MLVPGFARARYETWVLENNRLVHEHPELYPHYERDRREERERQRTHENRINNLCRHGRKHQKKPEIRDDSKEQPTKKNLEPTFTRRHFYPRKFLHDRIYLTE